MSSEDTLSNTISPSNKPTRRWVQVLATSGMILFFLFLVVFFSLSKLPETKVTQFIQGTLQSQLDPMGAYLSDQGREFSVWRGFRYRLIKPVIELSDQTRIEFDDLIVRPKLLSLLMARPGAEIEIRQGDTLISIEGSAKGSEVSLNADLSAVDLRKIGLITYLSQVKCSGKANGKVKIDGSLADLPTLMGTINLKLSDVLVEEQTIFAFPVPSMKVTEGTVDIKIEGGKFVIQTLQIGKTNGSDDLNLALTGDLALNRNLNSSGLNLRAVFGFSSRVIEKLPFVATVLANAKQNDGRYAYKLTGFLNSPFPVPDPKN